MVKLCSHDYQAALHSLSGRVQFLYFAPTTYNYAAPSSTDTISWYANASHLGQ